MLWLAWFSLSLLLTAVTHTHSAHVTTPYLSALLSLQPTLRHRFFFPGHSGQFIPPAFQACPDLKSMFSYDLPELDGLDSIHSPEGPLKEAMSLAAEYFQAGKTWFLVNGTTGGMLAAILALFQLHRTQGGMGDGIFIIGRDAHKSVVDGIALAGCDALVLPCHVEPSFKVSLGMDFASLQDILLQYQGKVRTKRFRSAAIAQLFRC